MNSKNLFIMILASLILVSQHSSAAKEEIPFDAIKTYTDRDFVLNDTLEFSLFDMSELKFINDSSEIKLATNFEDLDSISPDNLDEAKSPTSNTSPVEANNSNPSMDSGSKVSALNVARQELGDLPKMFYRSLRSAILSQKVPLTLYASESPSYSKPLKLFVKVKHIHLKPHVAQKDGTNLQPVAVRIYGQIKDKTEDTTLVKFYDTAEATFILDGANARTAFEQIANEMMTDLATFLRTKY